MIPVLVILGAGSLGFILGRQSLIIPLDNEIRTVMGATTLGNLLNADEKEDLAATYLGGDSSIAKMDEFSWAIFNVPTPFVGNGPMPGKHGNSTINTMQFRATRETEIPKPVGTFRIILTGGSTAFGSGAPGQDRTIGGYLEKLLTEAPRRDAIDRYEVVTAANPAWATTHERILIENRLSEIQPDLVISFSGNNDVHWGQIGSNILWFRTYADEHYFRLIKKTYDYAGFGDLPDVTRTNSKPVPPEIVARRLLKNVSLSWFALKQKGIPHLFVLQPSLAVTKKALTSREQAVLKSRIEQNGDHVKYFQLCYAKISAALHSFNGDGYRFVNMVSIFDQLQADNEMFIDSYHFGDKGNQIIARKIYTEIQSLLK
tara:strand:- start:1317 stop:2435 length:1119 start_codon:yes stop_codon:yes gene_type:complete